MRNGVKSFLQIKKDCTYLHFSLPVVCDMRWYFYRFDIPIAVERVSCGRQDVSVEGVRYASQVLYSVLSVAKLVGNHWESHYQWTWE